jgi:adsorption protein B
LVLVGFAVSGIDDLAIDLIYWHRRLGDRRTRGRQLSAADFDSIPEKPVAVLTATWHEHDVISQMLRFNAARIAYANYDFIIGTYPNDPRTQAAVDEAVALLPNVIKAVNPRPGPTSKADCLNAAVAAMRRREEERGERYEFIVLHDPEDVLHPLEFKLYNRIFSTRDGIDMVQTPIYSFVVGTWEFTAGAYMDEFAEQHTKNLYAREWATTFIPSAGVATAIKRSALDRLSTGVDPFGTHSLTEDYEIGLKLAMGGMNAIFVRQMLQVVDAEGKETYEVIATRAHFPHTFRTAVRQRTRWVVGIVYQARKEWGWVGGWRMRWMLFHDRKGPWAYATSACGYLFALYVSGFFALRWLWHPEWDGPIPGGPLVEWALIASLTLTLHRVIQQVIATTRVYGWKQGLLSIVRHPWATVVNLVATIRAHEQFRRAQRENTTLSWDKTQHFVPQHVLSSDA